MARFKIYSKDGQSVRYEGKPKYLGVYLNPSCLKFSEISSSEPIAWEVGDYVDYPRTGMRYRLYSIPQPSKEARRGSYGGAFRYSGVELYAATKELEIALFRDLVGNDNNIHFSTSPDVTTFENVDGIARRIQACMDYFYPGRWEIRVADFDADADAEIIEKISTAKDFALSGGTCLDALSKIYELWDNLGWIHSYENGKEVITIGYANKRIDANTTDSYLYGKGNGLTAIKKNQTNKDEFATRLYVYGSERNLPARYYNDKEILNAESVDIRNLMLPLDSWGKTDGLPDARKAYLENAEAVAKFGVIPKTHYFDSEDAGADIYPTIERLTIGEIRSVMQSTDEYYPTDRYADGDRADAMLDAINPTDDGVLKRDGKEYDAVSYVGLQSVDKKVHVTGGLNNAPIIINHPLFSKVVDTDFSKGKVVVDLSQTITIPDKGYTSVSARVDIEDSEEVGYGASHGYADFVATKSDDGQNWIIKLGRVSVDYSKTIYDTHKFPVYGFVTIDANTGGAESGEITIKFGAGSGSVGIKRVLDKTFIAYLKQIGFNINTQASLGKGKTISMKTGACAGRNFVISDCLYSSAMDAWLITCKRQQDDTLGILFPNSSYEIAEGDTFVLLDIAMPELYVSVAQNRLLAEGRKLLSRASKIQSNYEPSIDAKVMVESGRTLREGMFMEITDEDVIDNTTDYILIDTLSISEDESAIPTYKVTLRERRKVTYKGTPSATSATETKSVEDETEVQPNVDLTGYAKETYVNDKVSEVNNLLASMWTLDDDGNLITDRNVIIKKNVIIGGDTSTGGTGENPSVSGTVTGIRVDANTVLGPTNGIVDMSDVLANLDVDLSDYYTKQETTSEIAKAVADLNLGQYATKTALETLQGEVDNIESVLGIDEEAEGIINTWNEVKAFLAEIEVGDDLASILEGINTRIGNNTTAIGLIDGRVTVNEAAISDNATNIRNAKGEIDGLKDTKADWGTTLAHYGITDAYTKTEVANELAKYLPLESANQTIKGNITIEGNLIVKGDTSSTARGTDSGTDGTLIGVVVNGTQYKDETNGMLDLSSLMNQYALATDIPSLDGYAKLSDIPSTMAWTAITGKPSFASVATSGSYNDLSNKPTIPTTLPASDVYTWAKAATKPSYKTSEVAEENNLYFTNARAVNALADTLKDYVTKTALASDLGEYASKEWVNEKGYITGITLTGDDYISVNGYKLSLAIDAQGGLTDTGQGLGIYQIPSAKIVTDALGYTPLSTSGGKISAERNNILMLNASNAGNSVYATFLVNSVQKGSIGWYEGFTYIGTDETSTARIGVLNDGTPQYWTAYNGARYTLLHSGNYSSYALPLSGGTIKRGSNGTPLVVDTDGSEIGLPFRIGNTNKGWVGYTSYIGTYIYDYTSTKYLGIRESGTPFYYDGDYRTLYHTGNFNPSDYLPLSGGTIKGNIGALKILRISKYACAITFQNTKDGAVQDLGGLGFDDAGNATAFSAGYSKSYTLIHSGNIGSYAILFKDGISVNDDYNVIGYGGTAEGWPVAGPAMIWGSWAGYRAMLHARNGVLRFNSMENYVLTGWKQIAFADSNVASAQALTHSNGTVGATVNSSGTVTGVRSVDFASNNIYDVGSNLRQARYIYAGWLGSKTGENLSFGANNATHMLINSSGNVTIGGSDLAGTSNKLHVDGRIYAKTAFIIDADYGVWKGSHFTAALAVTDLVYYAPKHVFHTGNVLIGTTTDRSRKLQIDTSTWDGGLLINRTLASSGACVVFSSQGTILGKIGVNGSKYAELSGADSTYFWTDVTSGKTTIGYNAAQRTYMLDVNGPQKISGRLCVGADIVQLTEGRAQLSVVSKTDIPCDLALGAGGVHQWSITARNSTEAGIVGPYSLGFYNNRAGNYKMVITDGGNVGIGLSTTTPPYKLTVEGTGSFYGVRYEPRTFNAYYTGWYRVYKSIIYSRGDNVRLNISRNYNAQPSGSYTFDITIGYQLASITQVCAASHSSYHQLSNVRVIFDGTYAYVDVYITANSNTWYISGSGRGEFQSGVQNTETANVVATLSPTVTGAQIGGDLVIAGDMSSTSDMRLKQRIEDVVFDLKTIAEMPIFTFRWKDGRDDRLHLGSSAQYWEKPAPWLVMGDETKNLNYAVLGVAGVKTLAVTAVDHETRIEMLERKVNELETENRRLRYGN